MLPDFEPTEYLFETHKDKGSERWEIFAWAAREIMMKAGDLKPCDIPLRTKVIYEGYMQMNPKYKTPFPPTLPAQQTEHDLLVEKLQSGEKTDAEAVKDDVIINDTAQKE